MDLPEELLVKLWSLPGTGLGLLGKFIFKLRVGTCLILNLMLAQTQSSQLMFQKKQ